MEIADAGKSAEVVEAFRVMALAANVKIFTGGAINTHRQRVNVSAPDAASLDFIFRNLASSQGWIVRDADGKIVKPGQPVSRPRDICRIVQRTSERGLDTLFVVVVDLAYWGTISYFSGPRVTPNRPTWGLSHFGGDQLPPVERIDNSHPDHVDPLKVGFDIDVVYTWVNDADPDWDASRRHHAAAVGRVMRSNDRALHSERFRNRDELRYSLRSLHMFAPWVRNIYIVTADQTPDWLSNADPRLKLVSHRDIYSDQSVLPTFNSSGIETQLHHVEGLAEHFLYFNDDMFLGSMCEPTDFFTPAGAARFFPSRTHAVPEFMGPDEEEYIQADRNVILRFRKDFGISPSALMRHVPYPALRSVVSRMEQAYSAEFAACASQRFRSPADVRPLAFMFPYYAGREHLAVPSTITEKYIALRRPELADMLKDLKRQRGFKTFCLNDAGVPDEAVAEVDRVVGEFLASYFPIVSPYEKLM